MNLFCNKYGKECPHTNSRAQSYNCDAWDPREFLADKSCRHALTVDNMELAKMQWIARNKDINGKNKRTETPERPMLINKDGEILVKETLAKERIEMMRRQAAAAEKMAEVSQHMATVIEDIGSIILENLGRIAEKLEPIARMFGDDEEGDDE